MSIEVDIKKTFVVNGREYGSMDEMPEDVRDAIKKALSGKTTEVKTDSSIVLNGKKYASTSDMPSSAREIYEQAMKAAAGHAGSEKIADFSLRFAGSGNTPTGQGISLSFSLTPFFVILIAVVAAIGLYLYMF